MNKILKEKEITEALELDEEIKKFSEADDYNTENIYRQLHCESKTCKKCCCYRYCSGSKLSVI